MKFRYNLDIFRHTRTELTQNCHIVSVIDWRIAWQEAGRAQLSTACQRQGRSIIHHAQEHLPPHFRLRLPPPSSPGRPR